jgi:hypothetical protein
MQELRWPRTVGVMLCTTWRCAPCGALRSDGAARLVRLVSRNPMRTRFDRLRGWWGREW